MASSPKRKCNRSTTVIGDLNIDVLRDTFAYLNEPDLCAVADSCSTFREVAQAEFSTRYSRQRFKIDVSYSGKDKFHPRQMPSLFRNFGPAMKSFGIILDRAIPVRQTLDLMTLINRYCHATMMDLAFENVPLTAGANVILQPLLSRLVTLKLKSCWYESVSATEMLSFCTELQSFSVDSMDDFPFIEAKPKLESLSVTSVRHRNEKILDFLKANRQLKEMKIDRCVVPNDFIQSIVQFVPGIEKISYTRNSYGGADRFIANAKYFKQLSALKSLEVDCEHQSFSPVMQELVAARIALKCLKLKYFKSDLSLVNAMAEMTGLEELELVDGEGMEISEVLLIIRQLTELTHLNLELRGLSASDMVEIVRCTPKLREFKYCRWIGDSTFDESVYQQMLKVVSSRDAKCQLNIILPKRVVLVSRVLQKANADTLKITNTSWEYINPFALTECPGTPPRPHASYWRCWELNHLGKCSENIHHSSSFFFS